MALTKITGEGVGAVDSLDVTGTGGRVTVDANRGTVSQIDLAQTSSSADGGYIRFMTCDSGSTNPTERMRLLSGGGLTFNGDTAAANALDDYEEGTWTPVDASSGSLTIQVQAARYRKIGSIVQVQAFIIYPTTSDGSNTAIGGLPFSSPSTSNLYGGFTVGYTTYSGSPFTILKNVDDATFSFRVFGGTLLTNNQLSTRDIIFAGTYISV